MRTSTLLIGGISCIVTLSVLLTVGRAASANERIEARLQTESSRTITAIDKQENQYFTETVVNTLTSFSNVDAVFPTSILKDGTHTAVGSGGQVVPSMEINANLSQFVTLIGGRWPQPGEAIISSQGLKQLHLDAPTGAIQLTLTKTEHPLVGVYKQKNDTNQLATVLIKAPETKTMQVIRVVTKDFRENEKVTAQIRSVLRGHDPQNINLQPPASWAELSTGLTNDLRQYNASVLYGALCFGGITAAAVVFADALSKRADLGRRLALGATGAIISYYTIGRVVIPTISGIIIGSLLGLGISAYWKQMPPITFAVALGYLILLTMTTAAIPGAVWAAYQDPVRILRLP